jgi:hypothetical protein
MFPKGSILKKAFSIWLKWFLTQPSVFGLTAYPVLRLRLSLKLPLMDSAVGADLLKDFLNTRPRISRLANLQAAIGLLQLQYIDAFNEGARSNAQILTRELGVVPGVQAPRLLDGDHIYVYYPLTVDPQRRDDLRHYLLRRGIDSKTTDMADCSTLGPFLKAKKEDAEHQGASEASILEICVYPVISAGKMRQIGRAIRSWAGLPAYPK